MHPSRGRAPHPLNRHRVQLASQKITSTSLSTPSREPEQPIGRVSDTGAFRRAAHRRQKWLTFPIPCKPRDPATAGGVRVYCTRAATCRMAPEMRRSSSSHADLAGVQGVEELLRIVRRIVINNLLGVDLRDGADEVAELGARLGLQFENLLQAARHHEGAAGGDIVRKDLGKLLHHVSQDGLRCVVQKRLECRQMDALLDDRLECAFGLGFEVL
mmetsp:Transcript_5005/g.16545  ORF Transcript_5005/g.16545 Transcript_5005/m.16545 type:complete len:215 (+) Transcript_5005:587-1231(+)